MGAPPVNTSQTAPWGLGDELEILRRQVARLQEEKEQILRARAVQRSGTRVLERLACGASLAEVLHLLVESIEAVKPEMLGSVLVLDRDGRHLRLGAAPSLPEFYNRAVDGIEIGPAVGSCGTCAHTGERVIVEDVDSHPFWADFRDPARRAGLRACWSHPITSSSGRIMGTFAMYYREPRRPDPSDLELITFAAYVAGIAIERKQTEEALRASEEHFRVLVESAPVCIHEVGRDGRLLSVNRAGLRMIGPLDPSEILGKPFLECVAAGDRARVQGLIEGALAGRPAEFAFTLARQGEPRILAASLVPLRDGSGSVTKAIGVTQDVTERRLAERRQALMVQELDHRVKNNLAAVLSIAEQTASAAESLPEFEAAFRGRVRSMAIAHEMLARASWGGVELYAMLRRVLEPYRRGDPNRIEITGPMFTLPARVATPICMAIHELVVNAVKYGALSRDRGRVQVSWTRQKNGGGEEQLRLAWSEAGGPPVVSPRRRGRGTRLIERMIAYQLHGESAIEFPPEGVRCRIDVPVSDRQGAEGGAP